MTTIAAHHVQFAMQLTTLVASYVVGDWDVEVHDDLNCELMDCALHQAVVESSKSLLQEALVDEFERNNLRICRHTDRQSFIVVTSGTVLIQPSSLQNRQALKIISQVVADHFVKIRANQWLDTRRCLFYRKSLERDVTGCVLQTVAKYVPVVQFDLSLWCFSNNMWKTGVPTVQLSAQSERKTLQRTITDASGIISDLAAMVVEYLSGYVSDDTLVFAPKSHPSSKKRKRIAQELATTLSFQMDLWDTDPVGYFRCAKTRQRLFGGPPLAFHAHRSPMDISVVPVDEWLRSNGITNTVAFLWYATLGAWLDVGCTPSRRVLMQLLPIWISNQFLRPEHLLTEVKEHIPDDVFSVDRCTRRDSSSWLCRTVTDHYRLISMTSGLVLTVPRLYMPALDQRSTAARGLVIVHPQDLSSRSALHPCMLPFRLDLTPLEDPSFTNCSADFVRKAILCWHSLLVEVEVRDNPREAVSELVSRPGEIADYFMAQRLQILKLRPTL